jgi:hypothetical protein
MKITPEIQKAIQNMQPGVITQIGFFGSDHRTLPDIILLDEELFDKLGMTFEKVAQKLKYLLEKGLEGLGEPIHVDNRWVVKVDETRGNFPCPYEDGIYHKRNVQVLHLSNNKMINFSDLSIHLLEAHHFLQGLGSFYRLEPAVLKDVLEL